MSRSIAGSASFVLVALAFATLGFAAEEPTKDSVDMVKENLKNKKAIILDVREQSEWDAGHLKGARLLPSSKIKEAANLKELTKDLDKGQIIYTHCKAGRRALMCAEALKKEGFDVRALKLGYEDLLKAGFEKAEDKK
jgi:phage shock protein E